MNSKMVRVEAERPGVFTIVEERDDDDLDRSSSRQENRFGVWSVGRVYRVSHIIWSNSSTLQMGKLRFREEISSYYL